jgi:hypothetical protein
MKTRIMLVGVMFMFLVACNAGTPTFPVGMEPTPTPIPAEVVESTALPVTPFVKEESKYGYGLPAWSSIWVLPNSIVGFTSIDVSRHNSVWIGTLGGVFRFENGIWTQFTQSDGLPDNNVLDLQAAPNDVVWVTFDSGAIYYFNGKAWKQIAETALNNPPSTTITQTAYASNPNNEHDMTIASNGDLWAIGPWGIVSYDGQHWSHQTPEVDGLRLTGIEAGPDGTVWFLAVKHPESKDVLLKYDGGQWTSYAVPDLGEYVNQASKISIANDGSAWVTGESGEASRDSLAHFDGTTWKIYTAANGLADNGIFEIAAAPDYGILLASSSGLYRFNGGTCEIIFSFYHTYYYVINASPAGDIWLGGYASAGDHGPSFRQVLHIPKLKSGIQ